MLFRFHAWYARKLKDSLVFTSDTFSSADMDFSIYYSASCISQQSYNRGFWPLETWNPQLSPPDYSLLPRDTMVDSLY
jgi:hypothetical protein